MSTLLDYHMQQQQQPEPVGMMSKDELSSEIVELVEFLLTSAGEEKQEETLGLGGFEDFHDADLSLFMPMGRIDPNAALLGDDEYAGLF